MSEVNPLHRIKQSWQRRLILKAVVWALLFLLFALGTSAFVGFVLSIFALTGICSLILIWVEFRKSPSKEDLIRLVNEQFKSTEYSTELIFDTNASGITALQKRRVLTVLNEQLPQFSYPVFWTDTIWTFVGLLILFTGIWLYTGNESPAMAENEQEVFEAIKQTSAIEKDSTFLSKASIVIEPPSYTGLDRRSVSELDVSAPEQSMLLWSIEFSGNPSAVWLRLNGGDSLPLVLNGNKWQIARRPKQNELYTLNFSAEQGTVSSDYHEIQLVTDEPPAISIDGIPQFQRLEYRRGLELAITVNLADDYGLSDGFLTATITKGSGESVKFREQKVPFGSAVSGKSHQAEVTFNLDDLDMEPGNELYFYGSAFDNKKPNNQQSRTETFFYILEDTSQMEFSLQGALGIDLMPDYFRSQLQIILDTEKLVREKGELTVHDFNFESNALGFDQKQLRLKYGQFIGEEEDSGLEVEQENAPAPPDASGETVLDEFGHNTDKENEEGQWMDRGTESDHDHEEDHAQENNPLEAFMHNHEDEETSSFYTQTLKSKLKAALNEMWSAELYLRLFKPQESLPYQYKAQKLLKEIRNHARIYVQRIGFDPPPVNEAESRLTGKLKELNDKPFRQQIGKEREYPAIRKAIVVMDQLDEASDWNEGEKSIVRSAGDELAGLAIEQPGKYLATLNDLRHVLALSKLSLVDIQKIESIKQVFVRALPDDNKVPAPASRPASELTRLFIDNLVKASEE